MTPYRLEILARRAVGSCGDPYHLWGGKLAQFLTEKADFLLNPASTEYSRAAKLICRIPFAFLPALLESRKMACGQMVL